MADNYQFKEAFTDEKKNRRSKEVGQDANGKPILANVAIISEDQTGDPIQAQAANDGRLLLALELDDGQGTTGRITRDGTDMGVYDSRVETAVAALQNSSETLQDLIDSITAQNSYDDWLEGPAADTAFDPAYNAVVLKNIDGDLAVEDGDGNAETISQAFLNAIGTGVFIPVTVAKIDSASTNQTLTDVALARN